MTAKFALICAVFALTIWRAAKRRQRRLEAEDQAELRRSVQKHEVKNL